MGSLSVHIETFGCQMNVSDAERAATRLREAGYKLSESAENADVVLLNTCSVRARAEQKVYTRIGQIRHQRKHNLPLIGVMGCVAQLEGEAIFDDEPSVQIVAGTRATDRLSNLIQRVAAGEPRAFDLGERAEGESWEVSPVERHSKYVAFLPIIEGCNKFCTYCIVPYSRGREQSRPADEILKEVERLKSEGFKEVHLIGQNVNSYRPKTTRGLDEFRGATPFARLLRAVAATGMPRVKFTTSFPRDFHPDIVSALEENQNLCDWVHLPVQTGSDRVLRAMRRGHTSADYRARVEAIKNSRRRLALTSDVIVGYPEETEEEFNDTLRLTQHCQYDSLYIFKYSERKGTPAAKLPDSVSEEVKTERFLKLQGLQKSIQGEVYRGYLGKTVQVLVEGESSRSAEDLTGHTTCNKVVNFKGGMNLLGEIVGVRVTEAKANSLYGEVVSQSLK